MKCDNCGAPLTTSRCRFCQSLNLAFETEKDAPRPIAWYSARHGLVERDMRQRMTETIYLGFEHENLLLQQRQGAVG